MLVYTVPGGKRNRGLTVVNAFRQLANSVQNTEDNIHTAMVLGWCVEWVRKEINHCWSFVETNVAVKDFKP